MTCNKYSPSPQCSTLLPYAFWLVTPLLNLGRPGTFHTYEQSKPYHTKHTPLGFILFVILADHWKASLLMQKLWKLGAYQDRYNISPWKTQNWRTQPDSSGNTCKYRVLPRPATLIQ